MSTEPNLTSQLAQLQDEPDVNRFRQTLDKILATATNDVISTFLKQWLDVVLNSALSIVSKRPLLELLVSHLKGLSISIQIVVGRHAVEALRSSVASYEEQDAALREILAAAFIEEEEYIEAAKILQGVQLESSQRKISEIDRFNIWIRICRLYLEEDDTTTAETFLNRAKNLLYQIDDRETQIKFKLCQARISDSQRRFLEAGTAYHDISLVPLLADDERDLTLSKAIVCAILAPAGSLRTLLLRKLHRDERAHNLEEFTMLESMYLGRLISPEQSDSFAGKLAPHQTAKTSDDSTVLAKAVVEHNLLGISKLYDSISAPELGLLLGLTPGKAEQHAARMIEQNRLPALIDHVNGFVFFRLSDNAKQSCRFDDRIRLLLENVERVASLLTVR